MFASFPICYSFISYIFDVTDATKKILITTDVLNTTENGRSSRVVPLKLCYVVFNRTKKVTIQALGSDHFYVDLFAFL
jgi:hypothetical protein